MTVVKGDPKAPFQWLLHRGVGEGASPFPGLLHFTLDTYLIMLSVEQGGITYHFLKSSPNEENDNVFIVRKY